MKCPECGSSRTKVINTIPHEGKLVKHWRCKRCRAEWQI